MKTIRSLTRALAFLLPLGTICAYLFLKEGNTDIILGALLGILGTATAFYFDKE